MCPYTDQNEASDNANRTSRIQTTMLFETTQTAQAESRHDAVSIKVQKNFAKVLAIAKFFLVFISCF